MSSNHRSEQCEQLSRTSRVESTFSNSRASLNCHKPNQSNDARHCRTASPSGQHGLVGYCESHKWQQFEKERKTGYSHLLDIADATVEVRMYSELGRLWTCEHEPGSGV